MAIVGCVCVSGIIVNSKSTLSMGDFIIGIGSGVGYALYSIFSRLALNKGYSTMTITFYTFLIAAIGIFPFLSFKVIANGIIGNQSCIIAILGLVIFITLLPYIMYTTGLKNTSNSTASILACIEPVVATLIGIIVFHEKFTMPNIIGILLILGASVVISRKPTNT